MATADVNYPETDWETAVGYMKWIFEYLKTKTSIDTILDIGAAHGHFSDMVSAVFPEAYIQAIECNQLDHYYLDKKPYDTLFACLGEKPCQKTFYTDKRAAVGGGSSLYKEKTIDFADANEQTVDIVTLDSLQLGKFDLIKLDTQGSEVDIIKGGQKTIGESRFVLIEMSFVQYNEGGCLIDDVIKEMQQLGYRLLLTAGPMKGLHWFNYQPVQVDGLFAKETEPVFEVL